MFSSSYSGASKVLEYRNLYKLLVLADTKGKRFVISNPYLIIIGYVFLLVLWYTKDVGVQKPI